MRKLKGFSVKRTIVIGDTHFQPKVNGGLVQASSCHDPAAISVVLQIMKDLNPDEIIHNGDLLEMETISHWNRLKDREGQVLGEDKQWYQSWWKPQVDMATAWWSYMDNTYPKAQKHQLEGNHDYRSAVEFSRAPMNMFADQSLRNLSIWKDAKVNYLPYDGWNNTAKQPWVKVGPLMKVLHGYPKGTITRIMKEHDVAMCGHTHKIQYVSQDANSNYAKRCWSIGCLSQLSPDYCTLGGQQTGYKHAFAVIYTYGDDYQVEVVEINNGRVLDWRGRMYVGKSLGSIDKGLNVLLN